MKHVFKDQELKDIIIKLIDLKNDLKNTTGSIKYEYLKGYPDIIAKVDNISKKIINVSIECKKQKETYILSKQKLEEFKYYNKDKLEIAKEQVRIEAEKEMLKLIGNQILNFERKLLNENINLTEIQYTNRTRDWLNSLYSILCTFSYREESKYKELQIKYKKELSKQAKKEKFQENKITSSWDWEGE
jgi:hypothetical protein